MALPARCRCCCRCAKGLAGGLRALAGHLDGADLLLAHGLRVGWGGAAGKAAERRRQGAGRTTACSSEFVGQQEKERKKPRPE